MLGVCPVCLIALLLSDKRGRKSYISVTKLEALSGFSVLSSRDRLAPNLDFVCEITTVIIYSEGSLETDFPPVQQCPGRPDLYFLHKTQTEGGGGGGGVTCKPVAITGRPRLTARHSGLSVPGRSDRAHSLLFSSRLDCQLWTSRPRD